MAEPTPCTGCPLGSACERWGRTVNADVRAWCEAGDPQGVLQRARDRKATRKMPPLAERAGNALWAAGRVVKAAACGKALAVAADVLAARKAACAGCPKDEDGWCGACGCNLAAKQRLATEVCPLGRWPTSAALL